MAPLRGEGLMPTSTTSHDEDGLGARGRYGLEGVGAVLRHGAVLVALVCRPPGPRRRSPRRSSRRPGSTPGSSPSSTPISSSPIRIANPIWGSILDYVGLRVGMLMGVLIWTVASVSHGWMTGLMGFAMARALLGFGEGVTFPGGLRTAVESLPASKRARAIALSFSGGTLGGVAAPLIAVPIGVRYGWRAAFLFTGALGLAWMVLWFAIARPAVPAQDRAPGPEAGVAESARAAFLGDRVQLCAARHCPGSDPDAVLRLSQSGARRVAGAISRAALGAAARLGRRLFLLGLGGRSLRRRQPAAGRHVPPADRVLAGARLHHLDHVGDD